MIAALLQYDIEGTRRWLSFPRPAPVAVRRALRAAGWRYHRGHRSWFHDELEASIPATFVVARGGTCDYSATGEVKGLDVLDLLSRVRARLAGTLA